MARKPDIKGDRDNWGEVLNEYLDTKAAVSDVTALTPGPGEVVAGDPEGGVVGIPSPFSPLQAIDVWDAFDANGAPGSWSALTYNDYIGGLDASMSGQISNGTVVKTDLGVSSGSEHLYSYEAGDGPVNVLLVSGMHGGETLGVWATMRWFQQFVTSNDPQYRQLRNSFRVTWIPVANASRYRDTRVNANGVDLGRNFDIYWDYYADGGEGSTTYKGAAPESEPEVAIIASMLRNGDFRHVFDNHNYSASGDTAMFGLPGHYILGPRQFALDTILQWHVTYGQGMTWSHINPTDTFPMLHNYANYALRHLQGKTDSTVMLLEASADLFGSTSQEFASRGAIRAYAGMIQTHLLRVMENGFRDTAPPFSYAATGYRNASGLSTSITEGGALIDTSNVTNVQVSWNTGGVLQHLTETVMPVLVAPAYLYISIMGSLRSTGDFAGRHTIGISFDGAIPTSAQRTTINTSDTEGEYSGFAFGVHRYIDIISPSTIPRIAITAQRNIGGNVELYNLHVSVESQPSTEGRMMPRLGLMHP